MVDFDTHFSVNLFSVTSYLIYEFCSKVVLMGMDDGVKKSGVAIYFRVILSEAICLEGDFE